MSKIGVIDRSGEKVGPIWLVPGISKINIYSLLLVCFFSIGLNSFINIFQPYILSENLLLDIGVQGRVTSLMSGIQEVIAILFLAPIGALADKIGRRPVFATGFILIGTGFFLYPWATSIEMLAAFRFIYAIGAACVTAMLATTIADYPQDPSRGKLIGFAGVLQGLGVVSAVFILNGLPDFYTGLGVEDPVWAGRYSLWTVMCICLFVAAIVRFGMKAGTPGGDAKKDNVLTLMKVGLKQGKNPRIALSYGAAFVSRGDLVIVSNFLMLWLVLAGRESGLDGPAAQARAGMISGLVQLCAVCFAPVMGILIDRINRVSAVIIAVTLAAIGYINMGLLDDPLGPRMYVAAALLGAGEIAGVLASQALIAQDAPERERGSVFGTFGFFGAIGIFVAIIVGGQLFDNWRPGGPFIFMGCVNILLFIFAVWVRIYHPGISPGQVKADASQEEGAASTGGATETLSGSTSAAGAIASAEAKEKGSPPEGTAVQSSETPKAPEDPKP